MSVAIKKALKPFSSPVHCKRTYRELALLQHMRHDNVRSDRTPGCTWACCCLCLRAYVCIVLLVCVSTKDGSGRAQVIALQEVFVTPSFDLYGCPRPLVRRVD
jgi:hypothetical protein